MGVGNVPDKGNTEVVLVGVGMWQVSWVQFWTGKVWIAFESEKQRCMILLVFMGFHDLMKRFRSNKKLIHSLLPDKQYIEMLSVVRHCARCRLGFQNDLHYPHCLALLPSQPHPPPPPLCILCMWSSPITLLAYHMYFLPIYLSSLLMLGFHLLP